MFTAYFIGIVIFWAVGLVLWNKLYPKRKESE